MFHLEIKSNRKIKSLTINFEESDIDVESKGDYVEEPVVSDTVISEIKEIPKLVKKSNKSEVKPKIVNNISDRPPLMDDGFTGINI
jgi:hypothetical protein